jgi:HAD superfamily hydrolase (TIGR01509 family)
LAERRIKGLFLDLDGTLAKSLPLMRRTYFDFLAQFGKSGGDEEFDGINGPSLLEIVRILQERHGLPGSADDLFKSYLKLITDRYSRLAVPNDGALILLETARRMDLLVALVTSSDSATARGFLDANSLADFFGAVVTSDDVLAGKPDPALYLTALARLGLCADEALAVEDSIHGVASAAGAGIRTFLLDPSGRYADFAAPGLAARVSSLEEFTHRLKKEIHASR